MNRQRFRATLTALGVATALTVTGTGVAAAATGKPPKPFENTRIVINKSEGGIALGASEASVKKIFGASHCQTYPSFGTACDVHGTKGNPDVHATFDQKTGKLNAIQFSGTSTKSVDRMRTSKGIHLGSSLSRTKKAYHSLKATRGPGFDSYYVLKHGHAATQFVFTPKHKLTQINMSIS